MEQYKQHEQKEFAFSQRVVLFKPPSPREAEKSVVFLRSTLPVRFLPDILLHFQTLQVTPTRLLHGIIRLLEGLNAS